MKAISRQNGAWSQSPSLRGSGRFAEALLKRLRHVISSQSPSLRGSGRFRLSLAWNGRVSPLSQSPSLRGSGRFYQATPQHRGERPGSQSPSLRGSGRFWRLIVCDEVKFASQSPSLRGSGRFLFAHYRFFFDNGRVSIPFIAGQWSLRGDGAGLSRRARRVSIPFIAGQWSLLPVPEWWTWDDDGSQSPSLRGSGRFDQLQKKIAKCRFESQSPSLRGSGRFAPRPDRGRRRTGGLNPLHCGAVVASWDDDGAAARRFAGLNPLHCGAVVASRRLHRGRNLAAPVSIPFIAGQWSLPLGATHLPPPQVGSQSPSLRGSGRFVMTRFESHSK